VVRIEDGVPSRYWIFLSAELKALVDQWLGEVSALKRVIVERREGARQAASMEGHIST